jgi:regulator of sigma E protease
VLAVLAPILVFGLVIFVHEFGHFLAAKLVGVYTPRFSIGFGPALWRRRRGETEYVLAALPLGGYVRMASRHDEASAFLEGGSEEANSKSAADPDFDPNAMIPFGPKPVPEHRWFESKPLWARMFILLAGVTMNFVLGFVVAVGLTYHFGSLVIPTRVVGGVRPVNGQPLLAAIQPGDTILQVNDTRVSSWNDVFDAIGDAEHAVSIRTNRATVAIPLDGVGSPSRDDVAQALDYQLPALIGDTVPGEPASRAGLLPGDSIIAINGVAIHSWNEMLLAVSRSAGKPLTMDVSRGGRQRTISVTPKPMEGPDPATGKRGTVGKIGAYSKDISVRRPVSFGQAVSGGAVVTWRMSTSIVGTVHDLIVRKRSVKELGGPIAITRASVQAARNGWETLLSLIALLSINVAILNLLPIPILDGGQILINVLESAKGGPFSERTREYILRGGLFVIILLFVLVMFNDTRAWLR